MMALGRVVRAGMREPGCNFSSRAQGSQKAKGNLHTSSAPQFALIRSFSLQ